MPKTITDIIPPSRRRAMEVTEEKPAAPSMDDMSDTGTEPPAPPPPPSGMGGIGKRRPRKFPWGYIIAAVVVVLLSIGILFAFGGAKVEATPAMRAVNVASTFSATPSSGDLPYETVVVEATAEREIPAEGEETVDLPAQGTITIYNGQSKNQELINNTRFETPDGLIFRIRESVVVPGGTASEPGALQVTVYADVGGATHNIGPSTFTLPGLASSAAFDLVYAKSVAPMSGGFSGTRPSVATEKRAAEYEGMKGKLESDLRKSLAEKVADTHVLLPGAVFFSYTPEPDGEAPSDSVKLVEKGTATAFVFPKEALGRAIAYATLGVYTGQPVTIRATEDLAFSTSDGTVPTPGTELLSFNLNGPAEIVWLVDTEDLAGAIAGKTRDAAKTILAGFSELEEGRIILKPFWEGKLPADPSKIEVIVKEPKAASR